MTLQELRNDGLVLVNKVYCSRCGNEYAGLSLHLVMPIAPYSNRPIELRCPVAGCHGRFGESVYPSIVTDEKGNVQ